MDNQKYCLQKAADLSEAGAKQKLEDNLKSNEPSKRTSDQTEHRWYHSLSNKLENTQQPAVEDDDPKAKKRASRKSADKGLRTAASSEAQQNYHGKFMGVAAPKSKQPIIVRLKVPKPSKHAADRPKEAGQARGMDAIRKMQCRSRLAFKRWSTKKKYLRKTDHHQDDQDHQEVPKTQPCLVHADSGRNLKWGRTARRSAPSNDAESTASKAVDNLPHWEFI